ncbi:hypothetical protein HYC85_004986 [Camellia sinensis]|uniref:NmrA-like domain-containing protein n=1 Tax=Camellia sinensis TaxID=4442 RepID=A0A7J7HZR9_CAMSI|nr:hypothetical protein HYC85_004986 [Camellia sinensis]
MTVAAEVAAVGGTMIVGSTGFIGRFVAEACLDSGRPTFLLVRSFHHSATLSSLRHKGALLIPGSINDQDLMEKVLREHKIEVVISAVGGESILDQLVLIHAIKSVGTVKRFLPSEFGHDIDRADPVEPGLAMYKEKRMVRRAIEEAGIPYTYICCNSIAAWPYHDNTHPADVIPPSDRFHIYGDGSVKAYFVAGNDIGKFTIKSIDDDRTVNKSVHFQPKCNLLNMNELASLWEKKLGHTLPRVTITEDDLLAAAEKMCIPESIVASFTHDIFIKGCQINYALDKPTDVEVMSLYPDASFRTIDECFDDFLAKISVASVVVDKRANEDAIFSPNAPTVVDKVTTKDTIFSPVAVDKRANEDTNFSPNAPIVVDKAAAEDTIFSPNNGTEALAITTTCS